MEHLFQVLKEVFLQELGSFGFGEEFLMICKELVDGGSLGRVFLQAVLDKVAETRVPGTC